MFHILKTLFITGLVLDLCSSVFAYSGGTGEPNNPYQLASKADLLQLRANAADYSKSFILTADIDLDPCLPGGQVFPNAVINAATFQGTFDGSNHKIANFSISGYDGLGLFSSLGSLAMVKDLLIENCFIQCNFGPFSGGKNIGSLAGRNDGTITDCLAIGMVNGHLYTGGLVGWNQGNIINCRTDISVTTAGVSLIIQIRVLPAVWWGVNFRSAGHANITNCFSSGTVDGANSVSMGGLVGYNDMGGYINNCYSTAAVTGYRNVGGLVGSNYINDTIENCYSSGTVNGNTNIGGLVGNLQGTIYNSYSRCTVNGSLNVGGLVGAGSNSNINFCYSTGAVTGNSGAGGLVGKINGGVANSFWDTENSGQFTSAGGTGKTTAEMKTLSTFASEGWDFIDIWQIDNGQTYPYFKPVTDFNEPTYSGGYRRTE